MRVCARNEREAGNGLGYSSTTFYVVNTPPTPIKIDGVNYTNKYEILRFTSSTAVNVTLL